MSVIAVLTRCIPHHVQANHRLATNMQRRLIGRATDIHIRPLNEEKATQAATDLLGELFIFSVSTLDLNGLLSY